MAQPTAPRTQNTDLAGLIIAVACGLSITAAALFLGVVPFIRALSGSRDFVVYWATGHQLLRHLDPYDPRMMGLLEHAAGFTGHGSYYMRNPPWSLPLTLPLGFLSAGVAALPWSFLMLVLAMLSVRALWTMLGRPGNYVQWLGYAFPPALQCVVMGQTSLLLLIGLVFFLRWHRSQPFWAGASLWFCTLKPHLFLPWGVALLLWIVVARAWRVVGGAVAAMAASCLVTEAIDPHAWSQYLHWARTSGISHEFIPCLSIAFRNFVHPTVEWLAFVPAMLACLWALVYFWPRRHTWDWMTHGNLLILVSILVAPYCWFYDQCLAMPALLAAAAGCRSRKVLALLAIIYLAVVIQPYVFTVDLASRLYLWPAPAWLIWYLLARRSAQRSAPVVPAPASAVS
ncbi:MAG TPA: glycosyltransferase family 87 protein [Acidobacteriaceae bacterium]|nr:glycosyltransferase family 87 protein [Acidobacteriaceae bacterium]